MLKNKESISLSGYLPILSSKPLMLLIINTVFMFVLYWVFLGLSPILSMKDLGVSLKYYGYYQGVGGLLFALGFFGLIIEKFDRKRMLKISAYTCLMGLFAIMLVAISDIKVII